MALWRTETRSRGGSNGLAESPDALLMTPSSKSSSGRKAEPPGTNCGGAKSAEARDTGESTATAPDTRREGVVGSGEPREGKLWAAAGDGVGGREPMLRALMCNEASAVATRLATLSLGPCKAPLSSDVGIRRSTRRGDLGAAWSWQTQCTRHERGCRGSSVSGARRTMLWLLQNSGHGAGPAWLRRH